MLDTLKLFSNCQGWLEILNASTLGKRSRRRPGETREGQGRQVEGQERQCSNRGKKSCSVIRVWIWYSDIKECSKLIKMIGGVKEREEEKEKDKEREKEKWRSEVRENERKRRERKRRSTIRRVIFYIKHREGWKVALVEPQCFFAFFAFFLPAFPVCVLVEIEPGWKNGTHGRSTRGGASSMITSMSAHSIGVFTSNSVSISMGLGSDGCWE